MAHLKKIFNQKKTSRVTILKKYEIIRWDNLQAEPSYELLALLISLSMTLFNRFTICENG